MKKTDLAYMAGVFDGEGCIIIHKSKPRKRSINPSYVIEVCLANTNEWIVRQFHFSFGGNVYLRKKQTEVSRDVWAWQISANQALPCLKLLLPYLKLKRGQAEIAIKFQEEKATRHFRPLDDKDLVIAEANKILISSLNKGRKANTAKPNGEPK